MLSRQWWWKRRQAARRVADRDRVPEGAPVRLVMAMVALGMLAGARAVSFEPSSSVSAGATGEAAEPLPAVELHGPLTPADPV